MSENECQRCGECCRKGGPALHFEDRPLYKDQVLGKAQLLTLRRGEWVYDNVQGQYRLLGSEIVRLAAREGGRACVFFRDQDNSCLIYQRRPVECRALNCRSPQGLESMYSKGRMTRFDLVDPGSALGEVMAWHEQRCGYSQISRLCSFIVDQPSREARQELAGLVKLDDRVRSQILARCPNEAEALTFLFGRPL